jgi:hypothetical protein
MVTIQPEKFKFINLLLIFFIGALLGAFVMRLIMALI